MNPRRPLAFVGVGILLATVAFVGLVTSAAGADEEPGSGFQSVSLSAVAGAQRIIADAAAGQPPNTASSGVPDAEAELTGSTARARASAVWPTSLVGNAGSLLLLLGPYPCAGGGPVTAQCSPAPVPQPVMDQYHFLNTPVRAEAQYPTQPRADNSVPGATMTATAESSRARADALIGAASSTDAFGFGTTTARSSTELTGTTRGVADAHSSASGITFAGGLLFVGSVTSEAHAVTNGTTATSTGETTAHDMKVRDIPVYVDDKGIHAGSAFVPNEPATAIANQLLASFGYTVYLTRPTTTTQGGATKYDAGSLIVVWDTDTAHPGTKDIYFVFGGATVAAAAGLPVEFTSNPTGDTGFSAGSGGLPALAVDGEAPPSPLSGETPAAASPTATGSITPVRTATRLKLAGGINPVWPILALFGSILIGSGLRRLPDRVLDETSAACLVREDP